MAQPINISDDQLQALLTLRDDLDTQSKQAQAQGNAYMASVFTELLAIIVQRVSKVQAARHRTLVAEHRKSVRALRVNGHVATSESA